MGDDHTDTERAVEIGSALSDVLSGDRSALGRAVAAYRALAAKLRAQGLDVPELDMTGSDYE